jgi:AcrR family transcriptional regulator
MTTTLNPRDRILETASRLFYAHGIQGVGVDAIIAEAGVAKATLYKHFPSKDELVIAYLDRVDAAWRAALRSAAEASGPTPREQLVGLFDALTSACRRDGYRGCAFINTAAATDPGSPVHARTIEHKRAVRKWVRGLALQAGRRAPGRARLQPDANPRRRTRQRRARRQPPRSRRRHARRARSG